MLKILAIAIFGLLISPGAVAVCVLARGAPTPLSIPSQLIKISADEPVDNTRPIAQFDSPEIGRDIGYDDCLKGTEYGKRTLNLAGQNSSTKIYQTNIPGIGIKVMASNGTAFGDFPSTSFIIFPGGEERGTFDYSAQSFYRIQFFKLNERLRLTDPVGGDMVLPAGLIAYNYLMTSNPSSFVYNLTIGDIRIVSTPACTADSAKTVDFNDVTPTLLKNGVSRNLNFEIVCKSDYGFYSASASVVTDTPSSDGKYIRVTDANGNKDRLGIRITDSSDNIMKIDGTTSEQKTSVVSQGPADFSWKATLIPGATRAPAGGKFTAKAEIVFDIR